MRAALRAGADPTARLPETGRLALHLAATSGDVGIVAALLNAGADPNQADTQADNMTALWFSVRSSPMGQVAKVLIEGGADPNKRIGRGLRYTVLGQAVLDGGTGICPVLLAAGSKVEAVDAPPNDITATYQPGVRGWWTPLMLAAYSCNYGCTSQLLKAGANRRVTSIDGKTVAELACTSPAVSPDWIRQLLRNAPKQGPDSK